MNKKRTFLLYNNENNHEFNIIVETTDSAIQYSLYYSDSTKWTTAVRGKHFMSMIDDGNKVVFDKYLQNLDYSDLEGLRILLDFDAKFSMLDVTAYEKEVYRVVEEKIIFEI